MSRAVRRVPVDWQHPIDESGRYIPMEEHFDYDTAYTASEIEEGITEGWLDPTKPNFGILTMPDWPEEERTHYQMYETVSEGTPISPPMESPEALARWLVDNNANAHAGQTASYEGWLYVCNGGYAPSAVIVDGEFISGVEFIGNRKNNS